MEKESKARGSTGPGIGDVTDDHLLQRVSRGNLTARERAREPEYVSKAGGKVHEAVPYSRPYEHYDTAAMEQGHG